MPEPQEGEVRIRVRYAGICGSDLHIFHGYNPFVSYPRVIGHEFVGRIMSVGPGVDAARIGQTVVVDPVISCGQCHACLIGRRNVCSRLQVIGVHRDVGWKIGAWHDVGWWQRSLATPASDPAEPIAFRDLDRALVARVLNP